jgi:ribosomal protein S19E (S16A)
MVNFRASSPSKGPELQAKEVAGLRDVSNHRVVELPVLRQLEKRGFVEQKSGVWSITQQGQITLMFQAAK